jgi:hypothetical protein
MKFAFTGPAIVKGIHYERRYLIALAKEQGHQVQNKVDLTTDFLVGDLHQSLISGTKKYKSYMKQENVHTLRISSEAFLKKMGFL